MAAATAFVISCDADSDRKATLPGRWYTSEQVASGKSIFQANCAGCHGDRAQGLAADWRQRNADGSYPPPPLNGTAHAWHHPLSQLRRSIHEGGKALGGKMPGFAATLDDAQQLAVIAYFQSLWPDEVYSMWTQRGGAEK